MCHIGRRAATVRIPGDVWPDAERISVTSTPFRHGASISPPAGFTARLSTRRRSIFSIHPRSAFSSSALSSLSGADLLKTATLAAVRYEVARGIERINRYKLPRTRTYAG
jgi:hypothetical protein